MDHFGSYPQFAVQNGENDAVQNEHAVQDVANVHLSGGLCTHNSSLTSSRNTTPPDLNSTRSRFQTAASRQRRCDLELTGRLGQRAASPFFSRSRLEESEETQRASH